MKELCERINIYNILNKIKQPYLKNKYPYTNITKENIIQTQKEISINYIHDQNFFLKKKIGGVDNNLINIYCI